MIEAQMIPEAIQWHEGMLLAPQHFQQLSFRQETLLHYHLTAATPFHWGINRLKIDHVLLIDGILRIMELEAVMQDGLVVYHRHQEGEPLELDLEPYLDELKQKTLTVHLAVPAQKSNTASIKGALPRYDSVEGNPVVDENTGDTELSIPRLKPRINLLIAESPPQKYTHFPLLKLSYRNETISMTDFIPPTLTVSLDSPIGEMCAQIAQRLREKAVFLSERILSPGSAARGPMILETRLLIHSLVAQLPFFEAVLNPGVSHPYALYLALTTLTGHMATVGKGQVPPVLDTYEHNDLRAVFEQARNFVFRMIDEGIMESHTAIPFDFDDGIYHLKLEGVWVTQNLIVGVRPKPGIAEKEIQTWMEESLIGSETVFESMQEKRILGAPRKKTEGEDSLVPSKGSVLFRINVDPDFIRADERLQIFNTSDPINQKGPAEIVLYVKNQT